MSVNTPSDLENELRMAWPSLDPTARRVLEDVVEALAGRESPLRLFLGELDRVAPAQPAPRDQAIQETLGALQAVRDRAWAELHARRQEDPAAVAARAAHVQALFAEWNAEDAQLDLATAEADWEDFKAAMNANRAVTGERIPYP